MVFNFDINFLFAKKTVNKTKNISTQMYSQTLELISSYIKNVINKDINPLENLKIFLNIIEKSKEQKSMIFYKLNFIDELRFLILCNIENCKNNLKPYHAILHLISLQHKYSCDYQLINEFLNSNWHLNDEDIELHAMRGNFGKIIIYYPQLREAMEELCILENQARKNKITIETYEILHSEWKDKYVNILPDRIKEIVCGEKIIFTEHWTEVLCYKLAYKNFNNSIFNILNNVNGFSIDNLNDSSYLILSNQHEKLIQNSSLWLKLILNFIFYKSRINIYECITEIGTYLFDLDWHVALEYFSYTLYSDYYFNKICEKVDMNPVIFDYLLRYSKRNGINQEILCKSYSEYLIKNKDFKNLLNLINTNEIPEIHKNKDFIEYLLENIEYIEMIDCEFFKKSVLGRFLYLYINLIVKNNVLEPCELDELFDNEITYQFITNILDVLITKENVDDKILIKFLNYVNNVQKDLNVKDEMIVEYKKNLIYKLHEMITYK